MTEKLYYFDSHLKEFEAVVLSCVPAKAGFDIELDRTAFFPGGGGQLCDLGHIAGEAVINVYEKNSTIFHTVGAEIKSGSKVLCSINWDQRFSRMQNHSGEHIVSGLINRLYGFDNVGFHMGHEDITIDISGPLTREQIDNIEFLANKAVWSNIEVRSLLPSAEELAEIDYRSKLELTQDVRIVEIPGYDICACCAPHVRATGEIGQIKLLDAINYKGGVRIHMLCGERALLDYRSRHKAEAQIAASLSVKQKDLTAAFDRLQQENLSLKQQLGRSLIEIARLKADAVEASDNIAVFEDLDKEPLRELVKMLLNKATGIVGGFSGSDTAGYKYIIASETVDLRAELSNINFGISGKGGGSRTMIEGIAKGSKDQISRFINSFSRKEQ